VNISRQRFELRNRKTACRMVRHRSISRLGIFWG
jgi:hypothetical protein